jgi:hypothetical protein
MSAISAPSAIDPAVAASVESVIGIGQKRPDAVRIPSQTPFQSACVMKPSSGVKPPSPSITRSPFSREPTVSFGSFAARVRSRERSGSSRSRGLRPWPPWGGTRDMCDSSEKRSPLGAGVRQG